MRDRWLSEQIRRGVSFGGRLEVHLGNARFFRLKFTR